MDWLAMIGLTIGHTFWFFLLAGDIPGTAEHECWKRKLANRKRKAHNGSNHEEN